MVRPNSYQCRWMLVVLLCMTCAQWSDAQQFRLTVASPIAGNTPGFKSSMFVVRTDGCPEPAKARITATAEGLVDGARRSVALELMALAQPGAYAVNKGWPAAGTWVVNLSSSTTIDAIMRCVTASSSARQPRGAGSKDSLSIAWARILVSKVTRA